MELKPCPFCGGEPKVRIPQITDGYAVHVRCRCGVEMYGGRAHFATGDDAIAAWNTRANVTAALASAQAREEELRAEVEMLRDSARSAGEAMGVEAEARADAEWKVVQLAEEVLKSRERAERLEEALRAAMNEAEGCMFEAWLARTCPGGDVESVHRQWEASSEFEDFLNEWSEASAALSTNAATQTGERT